MDKRPASQDAGALLELRDSSGLSISSIHAPFLLASRRVWGRPREKLARSMLLARELGAGVVVVHLPYFWQIDYARWLYHHANQLSRDSGLTVAVENAIHLNLRKRFNLSFFNNLKDLAGFECLVFDTSHFAISHNDIFAAWDALKYRVKHIHLSNNYLKGFDDHELPHLGNLPLDRFLATVASDGYEGLITLELNPGSLGAREGPEEVAANLQASLEFCRAHYAEGLSRTP